MKNIAAIAISLVLTGCATRDICLLNGPCFESMEDLSAWTSAEHKKEISASIDKMNQLNIDPIELSMLVAKGMIEKLVVSEERAKEMGIYVQTHYHIFAYGTELDLSSLETEYSNYVRDHSAKECPSEVDDLNQTVRISRFNNSDKGFYELGYSYSCPPRGKLACGGEGKGIVKKESDAFVLHEIKWTKIYN